jgi:hypothetical protein
MSCVQFFFDVPAFFVGVAYLGNYFDNESYAATLILALASVNISLDLYYTLWACTMMIKFESPLGSNLVKALIGYPSGIGAMLGIVEKKKSSSSKPGKSTD